MFIKVLKLDDCIFNRFIKHGDQLVLLTDFDGTLGEACANYSYNTIDRVAEQRLHALAHQPNTFIAVISGREVNDLKQRVGIANITYSGNHGLQLIFANQTVYDYPIPNEIRNNYTHLTNALQQYARNGAWFDDKQLSFTYHYRELPMEKHMEFAQNAWKLIEYYGYRPLRAHFGIEALPIQWSKGDAAELILKERFGADWKLRNLRILYVGDDVSDEDVKRVCAKGGIFSNIPYF